MHALLARRGTTATARDRHKALYRNLLGRIDPEGRDLVVPSLVDRPSLVGTPGEPTTQIGELERSGIDELVIQPVVDPEAEMAAFAALTV